MGRRHSIIKSPTKDIKRARKVKDIKFNHMNYNGLFNYIPHQIDDKIWENDREMIFFKKNGSEYIVQPKSMLYRGSMCQSELYSNKQ